jgi:hypothetical protein
VIVLLKRDATEAELAEVLEEVGAAGLEGQLVRSAGRPMIHIVSGPTRRARRFLKLESVRALIPTSGPRVQRSGRRFYPYHFIRWSAACLVLFGLLVFLAGYLPPGSGSPIDVLAPPADLTMPWYTRAPHTVLALVPPHLAWVGWLAMIVVAVLVFALPLIDRNRGRRPSERWPVLAAGLAVAAAVLYLTVGGPT